MAHDTHRDYEAQRSRGYGGMFYQLWFPKGGTIDRWWGWDYAEHLRDDEAEFPEMDLDMARSKVWTVELDDATNDWYKCRRQKGINSYTSCLEVGEALRRAHWKQLHSLFLSLSISLRFCEFIPCGPLSIVDGVNILQCD